MCGLTGYIDYRPATRQAREAIVAAMAQTLYHRGPDDGGVWVDAEAGAALGFRRTRKKMVSIAKKREER